jgi:hypothetical protein
VSALWEKIIKLEKWSQMSSFLISAVYRAATALKDKDVQADRKTEPEGTVSLSLRFTLPV